MFIQITIDGVSAAGKSTVAREVAQKLNFYYVNSGYIFRSIALLALQNNIEQERTLKKWIDSLDFKFSGNEIFINEKKFNDDDLKSLSTQSKASQIAKYDFVRKKIDELIVNISKTTNIVIDGRSSGVFLFPESKNKFFFICDLDVRAKRRLVELGLSENSIEEVIFNLKERDKNDYERKDEPMQMAKDAICVNTSQMSINEIVEFIISHIRRNEYEKV